MRRTASECALRGLLLIVDLQNLRCLENDSTMLNLKEFRDNKIKWVVITLTILSILVAIFTNNKPTEFNLGLIGVIWLFGSSYIIPYIEKKDMASWIGRTEYNDDNKEVRLIFMVCSVLIYLFCLYSFWM